MEALGAAVRAQDGRGGHTSLERSVPAHFGLRRPLDVTVALYANRIGESRISELAAVAVDAARDGDAVSMQLIGDLADECAAFALAAVRRLRLTRAAVPIVLSGASPAARATCSCPRWRHASPSAFRYARVDVLDAPGAGCRAARARQGRAGRWFWQPDAPANRSRTRRSWRAPRTRLREELG